MRIVRLFQITDHYQRIKRGSCAFVSEFYFPT